MTDHNDNHQTDYTVGYGKPPAMTRFQKGQSGNPQGRPKGKRNVAAILQAVLNEKITVTENGKRKQITKLEAAFKQVVNRAASGETASTKVLMQLLSMAEPGEQATRPHINREEDARMVSNLIKRFKLPGEAPIGCGDGDHQNGD